MFKNLIESTSNVQQKARKSAYFGFATVFYSTLFLTVFVWSTFSFNFSNLEEEDLAFSTLVAPVPVPENKAPEPPAPKVNQPKVNEEKSSQKPYDVLREPVEDVANSTKPPTGISTEKRDLDVVRRHVPFVIGSKTERTEYSGDTPQRSGSTQTPPVSTSRQHDSDDDEKSIPPPVVQKPKTEPAAAAKKTQTISKGVINGIALNLPKPSYPAAAKAVRASGAVQVQVTIDESGNVISASPISGHPLLRPAARDAAQKARFTPTRLSDQPVKVTGVIVYNFMPN